MFEMQQRIVTVETTKELPNLVGNHCAEPLSKYLPGFDDNPLGVGSRVPATASPTFQEKCHARSRMPKRLLLNGLTNW